MRVFANFHFSHQYKIGVFYYIIHYRDTETVIRDPGPGIDVLETVFKTQKVVSFYINIPNFLDCYQLMLQGFLDNILPLYIQTIKVTDTIEFVADIPVNLFIPIVIPMNLELVCLTRTDPCFEMDEKLEYNIFQKVLHNYSKFLSRNSNINTTTPWHLVEIKNITLDLLIYIDRYNEKPRRRGGLGRKKRNVSDYF